MKRYLLGVAAASALTALPAMAQASTGYVTDSLNLRSCASTSCQPIAVLPPGAAVDVRGATGSWYYVTYAGYAGYASANYINTGIAAPRPQPGPTRGPAYAQSYPFPAPTYGYAETPRWDPRYGAWYDGHRWYYQGRWYNQPNFSVQFNFGGFGFGFRG